MKKYSVSVQGISPYLMHRFAGKDEKVGGGVGVKEWKDEVEFSLYKTPEGKIYIPSSHIHGCLIEAGKNMRVVGKGKSTYSKLFGAFVMIEPNAMEIIPQEFTIDERSVVIQKMRVIRYRPRWEKWNIDFEVIVHEDGISMEAIKKGLDDGGRYSGIGDYRPAKKGPFGRFIVTRFEEIQ